MTSGDGERPASADTRADVPAASAAQLCYDSDDLLTTRRGGVAPLRSRLGNGHVATVDSVTAAFVPLEQPLPHTIASADDATLVHDAALAGPPPPVEEAVSEPTAATPTVAELVQEPVIPLPPLDAAGTDDSPAGPTLIVDQEATQGIDAFQAQHEPEHDESRSHAGSTVADAPLVITASEPAVSDEGAAWHTAGTAEYPVVEQPPLAGQPDEFVPASDASDLPLQATNDIEIPVPVADLATTTAAYAPPLDEPDAATMPDHIAAPAGETIDLPVSQWDVDPIVATDPDIPALPPTEPPAPPLAATPPPPPAAPPPDDEEEEGATMTIIEHLEELRHRVHHLRHQYRRGRRHRLVHRAASRPIPGGRRPQSQ